MKRAWLFVEHGGLLGVVALVVYVWQAPAHAVGGDNLELSTIASSGGTAHPSGYPLYVLWLRAWSWLPATSSAQAAAFATAALGAAAVVVLRQACRAWGAHPLAASCIAAMFGAAPLVFRLHSAAEVFALNHLIVALVLWFAATDGPWRGTRRVAALGLVAGLGISNHFTCVLVAPIGLLGVARGVRESDRKLVAGAWGLAALVLGTTPYLYLFVAERSPVSWGHVDGLSDLVHHALRLDYGDFGTFAADRAPVPMAQNLGLFVATIGRTWLWLPAIGALVVLAIQAVRPAARETRIAWSLLAVSWLLAGPLLVTRFNIPLEAVTARTVLERFHALAALLLAIPIAIGVTRVGALVKRTLTPAIGEGLGALVFVAIALTSLPTVRAEHSPAVETGVVNLLSSVPPDAVVLVASDDLNFGSHYAQEVLDIRTDVTVVAPSMLRFPWYREMVARRGLPLAGATRDAVIAEVIASRRPLFAEIGMGIPPTYPLHPYGLLWRILPPDRPRPSLDEIIVENERVFDRYDLDYPTPRESDGWPALMHLRYAEAWSLLRASLLRAQRLDDARRAGEIMNRLAPR